MLSTSRNLCSFYFTHSSFFPWVSKLFYFYLGFYSQSLRLLDFDPFLYFQCVPSHWLLTTFTGPLTSRDYGIADKSLLCSNLLLSENSGSGFFSSSFLLLPSIPLSFSLHKHSFPNSHSLSFNYIFWMKESKSASLDSIILKHWYHNLNFLLDCSNRICHWLLKLNTSKITLLSPTFKPFFYSFASFFIHACLAKSTSEMSGSYPFLEFPLPPWN